MTVTYGELDAAIVKTGELLQRYTLLLEASSIFDVTPEIQDPWKRPFQKAWL